MGIDLALMVMNDKGPKWLVAHRTDLVRNYNDQDALGFGSAVHTTPLKFQTVPQEKYAGGDGYSDTLTYVPVSDLKKVVEKLEGHNRGKIEWLLSVAQPDQPVIFFWS